MNGQRRPIPMNGQRTFNSVFASVRIRTYTPPHPSPAHLVWIRMHALIWADDSMRRAAVCTRNATMVRLSGGFSVHHTHDPFAVIGSMAGTPPSSLRSGRVRRRVSLCVCVRAWAGGSKLRQSAQSNNHANPTRGVVQLEGQSNTRSRLHSSRCQKQCKC